MISTQKASETNQTKLLLVVTSSHDDFVSFQYLALIGVLFLGLIGYQLIHLVWCNRFFTYKILTKTEENKVILFGSRLNPNNKNQHFKCIK
uniref:Uncharacterized protein n=1 Tax=Lactuca sativa TaxID=4236 RepID=A0A9R1WPQ1_LACSA|nr:hypothetical protein LSAT_V11C100020130 [Lactuca sativa]